MGVIRISRSIFWPSDRLNSRWWTWIPLRNVKLKMRNSSFVWPLLPAHENARIWCQHQGTFFLTWSMLKSELLQDVYRFFSNLLFTFSSLSLWELKLSHRFQSSRTPCFSLLDLLTGSGTVNFTLNHRPLTTRSSGRFWHAPRFSPWPKFKLHPKLWSTGFQAWLLLRLSPPMRDVVMVIKGYNDRSEVVENQRCHGISEVLVHVDDYAGLLLMNFKRGNHQHPALTLIEHKPE